MHNVANTNGVTAHQCDQEANTETLIFSTLNINKCCCVITFSLFRHHEMHRKMYCISFKIQKQNEPNET